MDNNFQVFVPIEKSADAFTETEHGVFLRGYATTTAKDKQGDVVLPQHLDISQFIQRGYINFEHRQGYENEIGIPTSNTHIDENGLFVECKLWTKTPRGREVWERAQRVAKSDTDEKLGFSIEGKRLGGRDPHTGVIRGIIVTNVAVTSNPANPEATYEMFVKSLMEEVPEQETHSESKAEGLAHAITNLAFTLPDTQDKSWEDVVEYLDFEDRYSDEVGTLLLQLMQGISKQEALDKLNNYEEGD